MASPRRGRGRGEKEGRKANFLKKILNGDQATSSSFLKRKPTLKKKAMELQTLCGIDVCMVCFDPDGKVDFWPENEIQVRNMCSFYKGLDSFHKKEVNCLDLLRDKKQENKGTNNNNNIDLVISSLSNWIGGLSGDELRVSVNEIEAKIKIFKDRIDLQKNNKNKRPIDDCFGDLASIEPLESRKIDYYCHVDDSFWMINNHLSLEDNQNCRGFENIIQFNLWGFWRIIRIMETVISMGVWRIIRIMEAMISMGVLRIIRIMETVISMGVWRIIRIMEAMISMGVLRIIRIMETMISMGLLRIIRIMETVISMGVL
ncbi:uncharacterized protein [Euphorbia lathyris]|uniref:uncharacterized protein n=1 Tax=Euphorbia lathyris TaxID=212925 RepID=UPI003313A257